MTWTTLCELSELTEGRGKYCEVGGFDLAVFLNEGAVRVVDDVCPHAGASLADGPVVDGHVVCPRHSWPFNLVDGSLKGSAGCRIRTYETRIIESQGKQFVQAAIP